MNTKRLQRFARRVLKGDMNYALLRRGDQTIFVEATCLINLTDTPAAQMVPYIAGASSQDCALVYGNGRAFRNPARVWELADAWMGAPEGVRLTCEKTWGGIPYPAAGHAHTSILFATPDGQHVPINTRLLELVDRNLELFADGSYTLDMDARGAVRVRLADRACAIVMRMAEASPPARLKFLGDDERQEAEATA